MSDIRFIFFIGFLASVSISCAPKVRGAAEAKTESRAEIVAVAVIHELAGSGIHGNLKFKERPEGGVELTGMIEGLARGSTRGFHIHEHGKCEPPDGNSAGGHFNPSGVDHGDIDSASHLGDLGNITADSEGRANVSLIKRGATLGSGTTSYLGKSVIVHEKRDDFKTQPTGNSGNRIGCGVIEEVHLKQEARVKTTGGDFISPSAVTLGKHGTYLLSGKTEGERGYLLRITKSGDELLSESLQSPTGITVNPRKAVVYVADGPDLKIINLKKPGEPLRSIPVLSSNEGASNKLRAVAFSILNRRVYATDTAGNIWEIHPDSGRSEQVTNASAFRTLEAGRPSHIFPSLDGRKLYVSTSPSEGERAAIVLVSLKNRKAEIFAASPEFRDLAQLDMYKNILLVLDPPAKKLWAIRLSDRAVIAVKSDLGELANPSDFAVDIYTAVVLDSDPTTGVGRLAKIPIKID